ncbi:helix-turn-helix domain-containing protein [Rhizobium leucaenae]|uniref:helix-turn-helix domain-containing protein n=1 Tax=Rhizobium leucaenae TaxID=29450 RepID=UPI0007EE90C0|nr:hypothetical protein [Rhizobium leucaenae]
MNQYEYRAALEATGLNQSSAARLFGVDPRTSRRWASGELEVPRTVALCLRMMASYSVPVIEAQVLADGVGESGEITDEQRDALLDRIAQGRRNIDKTLIERFGESGVAGSGLPTSNLPDDE